MDGQHFQFFIALVRRLYRLAGRLLHLDLQRSGVLLPAALREAPLHVRNRGQSRVPLAQAVLRVRFPVERGIRLRTIHVRQLLEFLRGPVVAVVVQVLAAVVVQFLQPFDFFLRPLARFLFPFALFLCSFTRFLLAFAALLVLIDLLLDALFNPGGDTIRNAACHARLKRSDGLRSSPIDGMGHGRRGSAFGDPSRFEGFTLRNLSGVLSSGEAIGIFLRLGRPCVCRCH